MATILPTALHPSDRPLAPPAHASGPREAPRLLAGPGAPGAAGPAASPVGPGDTPDAIRQVVSRAAEALLGRRDLLVDSRYDERTGRPVYRIADQRTGEVLFESPPEELLRFFASMREPPGAPLVALDA